MNGQHSSVEKKIDYPAELTVKAVFRNNNYHTRESIASLYLELELDVTIVSQESSGGKFISYTITAVYRSSDDLETACGMISALEGFMTMF